MKPAPMTELSPELVEKVARAIAAELGDDFDAAYENKSAWIDDRGGAPFRDVNMPFKSDYRNAATAALNATLVDENARLREALEFYAREHNWRSSTSYMCGHGAIHCNAMADKGAKARTALSHKETNR